MSPHEKDELEDEPPADEGGFAAPKTVITAPAFLEKAERERAAGGASRGGAGEVIPIKPAAKAADPRLRKLQSLQLDSPAPSRSGGSGSTVKWIVLLAAGGAGLYYGYPKLKQQLDKPAAPVATGPVKPTVTVITVEPTARASTTLTASGYINAQDLITVGATVSGRVSKLLVANGDRVKPGQLLVQLDESELKAELRLAQARLHDAEQTAKRLKNLVKAEAATQVDYEKSLGQVEVARAEAGVIYPRLKQMQIVAPVMGTVIETLVEPGEVISPSAGSTVGVVKMADLSHLVVETDVNEADISLVKMGDRAEVSVESFPDQTFSGKVIELAGQADRTKGTLTVKVQLSDPRLRPGLSARVKFQGPANVAARLLIPKSAVQSGTVMVVEGGKVHRRTVSSRSAGPDVVEVVEGLKAGDRIVGAGAQTLADGDKLPDGAG